MALTTAQRVRLLVQDQPILANDTYYGDGLGSAFSLPHRNITSGSALVLSGGQWSATGSTFASGMVTFSGVLSANSAFKVTYVYTVFSDDEIDQFLADGGGVKNAAKEAVVALMFDGIKRAAWRSPDGSEYDDTAAQGHLQKLYDKLDEETRNDAIAGGSIASWSNSQGT